MASGSKNFYIAPEDGWVMVIDGTSPAITYFRASAFPHKSSFYVHVGATAPTGTQVGTAINCSKFWFNGSEGQKVFIKVPIAANDINPSNKLRIDVYAQGGALQ